MIACDLPSQVPIGQTPPDFSLFDLRGNLKNLHQGSGKVMVLYFWAEGCCKEKNLLILNQIYRRHKEKGFVIWAINAGEPQENVEKFVKRANIIYDVLLDERLAAMNKYGIVTLPTAFILDRKGIVQKQLSGPMKIESLEKAIAGLL
jgi:peroxiredoxin